MEFLARAGVLKQYQVAKLHLCGAINSTKHVKFGYNDRTRVDSQDGRGH